MRKKFTLALLSLLLVPLGMMAQNVTIRANNGSTIAAVKQGVTDTFFNLGGFATWQHEQLSMVLTVSDNSDLTPNGQLDNPANNLFKNGTKMQIAKGKVSGANTCYVSVSLPSGYRFTRYEIKFTKPRNAQDSEFNTGRTGQESSTFGEMDSNYSAYIVPVSDKDTTSASITINGQAKTIKRREVNEGSGEMGNVLYFRLSAPNSSRALIQLESAEFWFTSEENYSPLTPAGVISSPVSAVDVPFSTSRVDFGTITSRSYNGVSRVSYSSANVSDLEANFTLYEAESTKEGSGVDGISGQVVDYKAGTISSSGGFFKLGKANAEQVYYIESPSYVEVSDGTKVPVGYRITAAEFEYATSTGSDNSVFYITTTYNGTKYYLNTNGRFTTTPVIWERDANGYISSNGLYLYWNNNYASTQSEIPTQTGRFSISSNGRIYMTDYSSYYIRFYEQDGTYYGLITNNDYGEYATREVVPGESLSGFTLKIYDKEGANPTSYTVTGNGKQKITGLNNDAVKFGVQGIGLVRATLTLQALDPYLDHMSVVCQDEVQTQVRLDQTFSASDFSVSGGEFYFYLPADCAGHSVAITFENLSSKYFDESYTGGSASHTSRINFVKSLHYNAFGASNNNIYTNTSEAKNATLERLKVGIVGTAPFKFNNADQVGASGGTYKEYPFSLENYAASPNSGSFTDMKFVVSTEDQDKTRYVFTTDETRYNIAPTTAVQHRAYAFYKMVVHVQTSTYEPKVKFTKIYNQTLYGTGQTDAFYGAKVTAYDNNTPPKAGYSSTGAIFDKIDKAIKRGSDDFGTSCTDLKDAKQLLYLDFSEMAGIYQTTTDQHGSMEDFAATNAKNCLIFIPKGASAPNNNVCFMTEGGSFMAAHSIVLTDKEPFYSPYDIDVDASNKVEYKRMITKDSYGKVKNASLILPFAVTLTGGKHTNADGTSFSLHTMQTTNALSVDPNNNEVVAFFPALANVSSAAANTPYLVKIDGNSETSNITFTISQPGGTIAKSTEMAASDYTFSGASSTGNAESGEGAGNWKFTPKGTYAGQQVPKDNNIFYYANDVFVNSKDYMYDAPIKIAPFRAYFATEASTNAKLSSFGVIFEEGEGNETDAIGALSAVFDVNAAVYDLQGRMVATSYRELSGKKLAAGMYVVNGVKIIVK